MSGQIDTAAPPSPRVETILVVDDDVLIRLSIAGYLRECGFEVLEAGSADEAILILTSPIAVDLVFSDIQMPGEMDGFGLARWVRTHRPGMEVFLASGVVRAAATAADLCETHSILAKPYHEQQVVDRIRSLLGPVKPSISSKPPSDARPRGQR